MDRHAESVAKAGVSTSNVSLNVFNIANNLVKDTQELLTIAEKFPVIGVAFKIINAIYQISEQAKSNVENCRKASKRCQALEHVIYQCGIEYKKSGIDFLDRSQKKGLRDLIGLLEDLQELMEKYQKKGRFKMFRKFSKANQFQKEFEELDQEIQKQIQVVQLHLSKEAISQNNILLERTKVLMDIDEKIDEVNSKVDDLNHMVEDQFKAVNDELINIQRGSSSNFEQILRKLDSFHTLGTDSGANHALNSKANETLVEMKNVMKTLNTAIAANGKKYNRRDKEQRQQMDLIQDLIDELHDKHDNGELFSLMEQANKKLDALKGAVDQQFQFVRNQLFNITDGSSQNFSLILEKLNSLIAVSEDNRKIQGDATFSPQTSERMISMIAEIQSLNEIITNQGESYNRRDKEQRKAMTKIEDLLESLEESNNNGTIFLSKKLNVLDAKVDELADSMSHEMEVVKHIEESADESLKLLRKRSLQDLARERIDTALDENEIEPDDIDILETDIIGKGSFGCVYKAKRGGDYCAAKVIPMSNVSLPEQLKIYQSFQKEFALMCTTNTCQRVIHTIGIITRIPGKLILIMEYAENGSLRLYLDKADKTKLLEKKFVHNVIFDISYGMKELYKKGIHHRDLKAANVLLDRYMIAKVSDFGLSHADALITSASSEQKCIVGTPAWQSPEELNDDVMLDDQKCDVYSFAVTMWEILTCDSPWKGLTFKKVCVKVINKELRPTIDEKKILEMYGELVLELLAISWAQNPEDRPTFAAIVRKIKGFQRDGRHTSTASGSHDGEFDVEEIDMEYERKLIEQRIRKEMEEKVQNELGLIRRQTSQEMEEKYLNEKDDFLREKEKAETQRQKDIKEAEEAQRKIMKEEEERQKREKTGTFIRNKHGGGKNVLIKICQKGLLEDAKIIIDEGYEEDLNQYDAGGNTPLIYALWNDFEEIAALLIQNPNTDINRASHTGITPIALAVMQNLLGSVTLLAAQKDRLTTLNKRNKKGRTPLMLAKTEAMKELLIDYGAIESGNVGNTGNDGDADETNVDPERKKLLALKNAIIEKYNTNEHFESDGKNLLVLAAGAGALDDVKTLIKVGDDDPNMLELSVTGCKNTPLAIAAARNKLHVVKHLLEIPSIDVNLGGNQDRSPLLMAAWNGHPECVKVLLMHPQIDVFKADVEGNTPLSKAKTIEIANLIKAKPVEEIKKKYGLDENAFVLACAKNDIEDVKTLIASGEDVNQYDKNKMTPLLQAAVRGHVEIVKLLIACPNIKINKIGYQDRTGLLMACWENQVECVRLILTHEKFDPKTINKADRLGNTPLKKATKDEIQVLLDKFGAAKVASELERVKKKYAENPHPLVKACREGNLEDVKILVDGGEDINKYDLHLDTPLVMAAWKGHADIAKYLLACEDIDVNKGSKNSKQTPLFYASWFGHEEIVKLILEKDNVDVEAKTAEGHTALSYAKTKSIKRMLRKKLGIAIDTPSGTFDEVKQKYGNDALLQACKVGAVADVRVLIDGGMDVNAKGASDFDNTPLSRSCANGHAGCVRLLLAVMNIDVNKGGYHDRSPLLMCTWEGHTECVELLLHHPNIKPSLTKKDKSGNTPVSKAKTAEIKQLIENAINESSNMNKKVKAIRKKYNNPVNLLLKVVEKKNLEDARILLNSGTEDVNQCNSTSKVTPLIQAAWSTQVEMVKLLLKQPTINVNAANKSLTTALHWGCSKSSKAIVVELLKHPKINVHLKTISGRTAMFCCGSGNADIKALLKQHGAGNVEEIQTRYGNSDELIKAAKAGNVSDVKVLIEAGFDINLKGSSLVNDNTALSSASSSGHDEVCRVLLDCSNVDVNKGGYKNRSPLLMCAWQGHKKIVSMLLQRADITPSLTAKDDEGNTPISKAKTSEIKTMIKNKIEGRAESFSVVKARYGAKDPLCSACKDGALEDVKVLVHGGLDVNKYNINFDTPLVMASWKGHVEVVRFLISQPSIDVNKGSKKTNQSPLFYASWFGHEKIVKMLLEKPNIDVKVKTKNGHTALSYAKTDKIKSMIQAKLSGRNIPLATSSTDLDAVKARYGNKDELVKAAKAGSLEDVKLLVDGGVDVNTKGSIAVDSNTALTRAAASNRFAICEFLINHPDIDVNKGGYNNRSPLLMASWVGALKIVELLLAHPNIRPSLQRAGLSGYTPISKAKTTEIKNLIQAKIDGSNNSGRPQSELNKELVKACKFGQLEKVKAAILDGAEINGKVSSEDDNTALSRASASGYVEICRYLITLPNIDLNLGGYKNRSPLLMCSWNGHPKVVELLLAQPSIEPSLKKAGHDGNTPLSKAKTTAIKKMIQDRIDTPFESFSEVKRRYRNQDALVQACKDGNLSHAQILINGGENINLIAPSEDGHTPLTAATLKGHTEICRLLLAKPNLDMHAPQIKTGKTALLLAALHGHTDIVIMLLATNGIKPSLQKADNTGKTPIASAASVQIRNLIQAKIDGNHIIIDTLNKVKLKYGSEDELVKAAKAGNLEDVKVLIDGGEDINRKAPSQDDNTPLARAAASGHTEVARLLINHPKINVNKGGYMDRSPLLMCSWEGHTEIVELLLRHPDIKPSLLKAGKAGHTPLSKAKTPEIKNLIQEMFVDTEESLGLVRSKYGNTDVLVKACKAGALEDVRLLVECGADINETAPSQDNNTALSRAAASGHLEVCQYLLTVPGIDVNKGGYKDRSPLLMCSWNSHIDIVHLLLQHPYIGPSLTKAGKDGNTPLKKASNPQIKDALADKMAEIKLVADKYVGESKLVKACETNNLQDVKLLICNGEDVNQRNQHEKRSPLIQAVVTGSVAIVKFLISHPKINVNLQDRKLSTALHWSCSPNPCLPIAEMLLNCNDIDISLKDDSGQTALDKCVSASQNGIKTIIEAKRNLNNTIKACRKRYEQTGVPSSAVLVAAVKAGNIDDVKLLIEDGNENVNKRGSGGVTPLIMASWGNKIDIVAYLLTIPEVKVNEANDAGATALHWSLSKSHFEIQRMLINDRRIDLLKADKNNKPPIWYAAKYSNLDTVQLILSKPNPDMAKSIIQKATDGETTALNSAKNENIAKLLKQALEY